MPMSLTRRSFLKKTGAAAAAGSVLGKLIPAMAAATEPATSQAADRPNILFLMADDWGFPHSPIYGDKTVKTPTFEQLAKEGVVFEHAYCCSPSCSPSRASVLTGQMFYRLEEAANLYTTLSAKFAVYPDILEAAGYVVGRQGKGWGPGNVTAGGRKTNPAGRDAENFAKFLKKLPAGKSFCYWFGSFDPHRPYRKGIGVANGMKLADVNVPAWLPDTDEVRSDLLDYYWMVQKFDKDCAEILKQLEGAGLAENTIVVSTGDNGMPFPRAKCHLYDCGVHQPLAIRWSAKVKGGRRVDDYVRFDDFAPTFLQAAGLPIPKDMTGGSLLDILTSGKSGQVEAARDHVVVGRERHDRGRDNDLGYPMRAVHTKEFVYIRNFKPDRWPMGDPDKERGLLDSDPGPTRTYLADHRNDPKVKPFFELAAAKRPAEELYDLKKDPDQLVNVADKAEYAATKKQLSEKLMAYLSKTADPRAAGKGDEFDKYPWLGDTPEPTSKASS